MARPLRIKYSCAVYHVTSRGNARERIYLGDDGYVQFLGCLCYEDKKERDKAIFEAHIRYGYTLKEVAGHIGVHYTTVSRAINMIEGKQKK